MTARIAQIWRHPIKAHGRERLDSVTLSEGRCLPYDRHWAVAHEAAKLGTGTEWVRCINFLRGAKAPELMAMEAALDETTHLITLTHPKLPEITIHPEDAKDVARFIEWLLPICPENRPAPAQIISANRGMTDSEFPSIALINMASHKAVEAQLAQDLSPQRWRGNLLIDGLEAWAENDWVGKRIRIGTAELDVLEKITRCVATTVNTTTGERDADTLGALRDGWGHQEFGLYGVVTKGGPVAAGSEIEVIA